MKEMKIYISVDFEGAACVVRGNVLFDV